MNYSLCYDDVLLEPRYSEIRSRSEINIGNSLSKDVRLDLPILSAPMDTVTQEQCKIVRLVSRHGIEPAAAVGTQGDFLQRAKELVRNGAKIICIDVAHGHHVLVKEAIRKLKNELNSVHIMAGNVATARAFEDLSNWGADSIKVGIGGGSICSTRIQTGHGVSALQSVMDCSSVSVKTGTKLIADGGIKNSGDIVKALAAGADFVMLGSLLAGTQESPGDVINTPNGKFKTYRGMASKEAQRDWKGSTSSREGISTHIPFKGNVDEILEELSVGIRSGFSYTGARTLPELHEFSKFIKQTNAGRNESNSHILNLK